MIRVDLSPDSRAILITDPRLRFAEDGTPIFPAPAPANEPANETVEYRFSYHGVRRIIEGPVYLTRSAYGGANIFAAEIGNGRDGFHRDGPKWKAFIPEEIVDFDSPPSSTTGEDN
jgi:hypothetical protein